jgi:hypothetical protein
MSAIGEQTESQYKELEGLAQLAASLDFSVSLRI